MTEQVTSYDFSPSPVAMGAGGQAPYRPERFGSHQDEIDYVTGRSGSRDIVDMACRLLLLRDALEDSRRALREADRRCIIGDAFSNAYARQTMRNVADRIDAALTAEGA